MPPRKAVAKPRDFHGTTPATGTETKAGKPAKEHTTTKKESNDNG